MNPDLQAKIDDETINGIWGVWYLSFVDHVTGKWRGGCMVQAWGPITAVAASHRHECNPGGHVEIRGPILNYTVPEGLENRLLTKKQLELL